MSLDDFKKKLQKVCKGTHIETLSESCLASDKEWFTSPALDLNRILSGSFYKSLCDRTFALIVGPEASFKSSFMCICAADAQRKGYTPIIIDTEGAYTNRFVSRWGLDPENALLIYTPWVDKICSVLATAIEDHQEKLCIIVDSIGGIEKIKLVDDAADGTPKADQGSLQKEIKRMLKLLLYVCKANKSIALASGHYYGNPSGYGDAEKIGGGFFCKLAPDVIITLKKTKLLDADKNVIGNRIKAITMKNREYPPFNEAIIDIDYKTGINKVAGLVEMASNCGVITQTGLGRYSFPNGDKVHGVAAVEKYLNENIDAILPELEKVLLDTGYSTINNNVKEAEELASTTTEDSKEVEELEKVENLAKRKSKKSD
jgi:RecA/RadA recombinase